MKYMSLVGLGILFLLGVVAACGTRSESVPLVSFTTPQNGASVTSPFKVHMAAEHFRIEPAGTVNVGAGHLHIMIDTPCVPAGQSIPSDDTHKHFSKAQLEAELSLAPGAHSLCLEAADGAHIALAGAGLTQQISITVK